MIWLDNNNVAVEAGDINIPDRWGPKVKCPHIPPLRVPTKLEIFYDKSDAETQYMLELAGYRRWNIEDNYEEVVLSRFFDIEARDFVDAGRCSCGKVYYKYKHTPFEVLMKMGLD